MLLPEGVLIDGTTGAVSPESARYTKHLSELRGIFQDEAGLDALVLEQDDPVVCQVVEYKKTGSDLFFGTNNGARNGKRRILHDARPLSPAARYGRGLVHPERPRYPAS